MIDLKQFRSNASVNGICDEYAILWDNSGSKKHLVDLAFSMKGIDYICDAIAKGWGISPQYICNKFGAYINGKYLYDNKYTSTLYCMYNGDIECDTTALTLIDCKVVVTIPEYHICEIYATGNTEIRLKGKGSVVVIAYGDAKDVVVIADENIHYKRIQKKDRD